MHWNFKLEPSEEETVNGNLIKINVIIRSMENPSLFIREIFDVGFLDILRDFRIIKTLKHYKPAEILNTRVVLNWADAGIKPVPLNRKKFKWTAAEELEVQFKYFLINKTFYADQWSLRSDEEMQDFYNRGFRIECFGSPFNVRLPYFGSLFPEDEPFGSLGDCISLLKKLINTGELKWRSKTVISKNQVVKLIFSPSTYDRLIFEIFDLLKILFKKRKCIVHFGLTADFHILIDKGSLINTSFRYMLQKVPYKIKPLTDVKCFHGGTINMKGRVTWNDYIFKN